MKTIWKFELETTDRQKVEMPIGAKILTVQTQNETPCLWALVNPERKERKERYFEVFGTGHKIPLDLSREYIGTYQLKGGSLVFHVFEIAEV